MTIKLGIVMDPIEDINPEKDTSYAMLLEAQARGYEIFYMQPEDIYLKNAQPYAITSQLKVWRKPKGEHYGFGNSQHTNLAELDIILIRQDPPFDSNYLFSTQMLELAEQVGVLVVNKPQSLRDANEKLFTAQFPQTTTPTLVTAKAELLREFIKEQQDTIFKPLDAMGGSSIFRVKQDDPNISVIIENMTELGTTPIMAQKFIPEISQGDKRIILIDGEPIPYALARIPQKGETRGNIAAGGSTKSQDLTERDIWLCQQIAPTLKEKGLIFVGLDVIGDFITEINVTSPTGVQELDRANNINISAKLFDVLEAKLAAKK